MAKPVAIYKGVDSGGNGCPCITQPAPLEPARGNVFGNKVPLMKIGDALTPVAGNTGLCTIIPVPCSSPRTVTPPSSPKIFVNKKPVATVGAVLNPSTGIVVPKGSTSVFV